MNGELGEELPYGRHPMKTCGVELFFRAGRAGREGRYNGHVVLRQFVGRNSPELIVFRVRGAARRPPMVPASGTHGILSCLATSSTPHTTDKFSGPFRSFLGVLSGMFSTLTSNDLI
jgi:hypothetical protein